MLSQCHPDLRRYARLHCRMSDVDDAVQESMLALASQLGTLKAIAAFAGWMFTIVKRQCLRLARAMVREVPLNEEWAEQALAHKSDSAMRLDLIAALESLPPHYREVILLCDFEELSVPEIAARLRVAAPGVKSRLHRARLQMREYLLSEANLKKRA
ncbi:MAG: RNA polymerase sigma factor [Massilia sp.]